jgi:type III secretion system low calcium response chaperone LcrH/SycD
MESIKDIVNQAIAEKGNDLPAESKKALEKMFIDIFENDAPPAEAMGFGQEMLDFAYHHAYSLFEAGKHKEALCIFIWLKTLEPLTYRYLFGVAACYHHLKEYANATGDYMMCAVIETDNPEPDFYAADCFISLHINECAIMFLETCLKKGKKNPKHNQIHEIASMTLKTLKGEIK